VRPRHANVGRMRIVAWVSLSLVAAPLIALGALRGAAALRESETVEDAAPRHGRLVPAGDVRVFVQEAGRDGDPAVLFMHGTGAWSETWRPTLASLAADHFHAFAMDAPPFGFSSKPADERYDTEAQADRILALMDALHLDRAVLVSHSFGARATVAAALRAPHRVAHLVLVDSALGLSSSARENAALPAPAAPGLASRLFTIPWLRNVAVAATAANPLLTRKLVEGFVDDPRSVTPEIVALYQAPMRVRGGTEHVGAWAYAFLTGDEVALRRRVHALASSGLRVSLLWGERDAVTPLAQAEYLREAIPGAELRVIAGAGHIPHLEAHEAFERALLATLAGDRPPPPTTTP
jgi:pimeloyl-ACP methyl ester carboxylesterase